MSNHASRICLLLLACALLFPRASGVLTKPTDNWAIWREGGGDDGAREILKISGTSSSAKARVFPPKFFLPARTFCTEGARIGNYPVFREKGIIDF